MVNVKEENKLGKEKNMDHCKNVFHISAQFWVHKSNQE